MRVVEAKAEILETENKHPYEVIERVGRTCYKSEDNISDGTAIRFVGAMKKNKHYAMLEHYNLILQLDESIVDLFITAMEVVDKNDLKYINISPLGSKIILSGSFRAWIELFDKNNAIYIFNQFKAFLAGYYPEIFETDIKLDFDVKNNLIYYTRDEFIKFLETLDNDKLVKELAGLHLTHTILFTCDRGVTHEFVRHRPCSFAQESTRYCNYSKDKFDNQIAVIRPLFFEQDSDRYKIWEKTMLETEKAYFDLLELGCTPQEARTVLPHSLKVDIVITATEHEWQHILDLRYEGVTGNPHPQMVEVMKLAYPLLMKASNNRFKKID